MQKVYGSQNNLVEKVRSLRAQGVTFREIQQKLNIAIPKSTISGWCKGVDLPKWFKKYIITLNALNLKKAQQISIASRLAKQDKLLKSLWKRNAHLSTLFNNKDFLRMLLSFLYLGEGSKWRSHSGLMLGSSDPDIIRLYICLLNRCYGINISKLRCRISYRADQNLKELESYWSKVTSVPLKNFYKTKFDPRTLGKPTIRSDYKGVCVIMTSGTEIQQELELIPKIVLKGLW